MTIQAGELAVESRNVFGILKKWLYEEPDVVFRELVSNASDAIAKRRDLARADGAAIPPPPGRIDVVVDVPARTLTFSDDGIGMTAHEVDRYINTIALSGAAEFVEALTGTEDSVIGHFGVGFYSAFMLTDRVELQTLSHRTGAEPVHWECTSEMQWTMDEGSRRKPGTSVVLHLLGDSPYLAGPDHARTALTTYVRFLRTPLHYRFVPEAAPDSSREGADEVLTVPDVPWRRPESTVSPDELKAFYREHFSDPFDPVLWVRLESVDLGLRGYVFLRDTRQGTADIDGRWDVYSRGVLVGSDVARLVPKFARLASGVIECDDLPLVVSRGGVREAGARESVPDLVNECISQELTLRMNALFTKERATYERLWPELGPFVKYGVLTDRIFASVMLKKLLFADLEGGYQTLGQYLTANDAHHDTVFYTSDPVEQAHYVGVFRRSRIPALVLDHVIDQPLMRGLEMTNRGLRFQRLDSDLLGTLSAETDGQPPEQARMLADEFAAVLADRLGTCDVQVVNLRVPDLSVVLTLDEASRRVEDLMELYGVASGTPSAPEGVVARTLLVNATNTLVSRLLRCTDPERRRLVTEQLVDLALVTRGELGTEQVPALLTRSEAVLVDYLRER